MPINEDILDDESVVWYQHPMLDVEVDEGGTHLHDLKKGKLRIITKHVWQNYNWVASVPHYSARNVHTIRQDCFGMQARTVLEAS